MNVINFYKKSTNLIIKIIIGFYVICFMIASINHIVPFITGRLFVYQKSNDKVPIWLNMYWTSLSVFDPLAIIILSIDIRKGLFSYLVIIISDVIINYWFVISHYSFLDLINLFQLSQLGFLIFLLTTFPYVLKEVRRMQLTTAST